MTLSNEKKTYKSSTGPCDLTCLRGLLIAFNFIFILGGACAFGVGIWSVISKMQYASLLGSVYYNLIVYLLITAGFLVLITGIIGCVGAFRKNRTLLTAYFVLLFVIFAAEIIAGIVAFVYHEAIHNELVDELRSNLNKNYNQSGQDALTKSVDDMQQEFQCCGVQRHSDWKDSTFIKQSERKGENLKTPVSCCKSPSPLCSQRDHPSNIYRVLGSDEMGCLNSLEQYLKDHLFVLAVTGITVAVLEILVMIFSCFLRKAIDKQNSQTY